MRREGGVQVSESERARERDSMCVYGSDCHPWSASGAERGNEVSAGEADVVERHGAEHGGARPGVARVHDPHCRGAVAEERAGRVRCKEAKREISAAAAGGSGGGGEDGGVGRAAGRVVGGGADDGANGVGVRASVSDLQLRVVRRLEASDVDLVGAGGERASDAGEGGGGVDAVIGDGERAVDVKAGPASWFGTRSAERRGGEASVKQTMTLLPVI
jgi:hypothetical protein